MKVPTTPDGVCYGPLQPASRPVPRNKKSLATSLCAASSASWAVPRRSAGPYRFSDGCFCLSPEHHGAQFQQDDWELRTFKGHC